MIETLLDLFKTLTDPPRLIQLLSTVMTGWLGYALLFGIVFAETGLLIGFFLPGDSLLFTVGVVAGAGQLDMFAINALLIIAAIVGMALGTCSGSRPDHMCSIGPTRASSSGNTSLARKSSTTSTAARRSSMRASCHRAHVRAVHAAWLRCRITVPGVQRVRRDRLGGPDDYSRILPRWCSVDPAHFEKVVILIILISVLPVVFEVLKSRRQIRDIASK
jgi:hypothetical protein